MKTIVLLSPAHPLRGGIASLTERLAQELQEEGYRVIIYSFSLQYPSLLFPGKTQYTDDPAPKGLHILTRINSINPLNWIKVGREIRRMKPDLVISRFWIPFMGPALGTIIRQIRKNGHTKAICIADNIVPHEKRPGDRQLTQYYVNAQDGFVVMSRSVGDDLRRFTSDKPYTYLPHPVYDNYGAPVSRTFALEKLGLSDEYTYLLFFGFIRDYKGLDLLLKAMDQEAIRKRPIRLIVAGEYYSNEAFYQELIDELQIRDQLILRTSYIPKEEVRLYFGAADLVVQPYKSATVSGISQLAYHFGRSMVVTRVGGLPEIVDHGKVGYVVDLEPAAIAEAVVDFVDHNRKEAFEAAVVEHKKQFSWGHFVNGIRELYSSIREKNTIYAGTDPTPDPEKH